MLKEFKCCATCQARRSLISTQLKKKNPRLGFLLASLTPSDHHLWVGLKGKMTQKMKIT